MDKDLGVNNYSIEQQKSDEDIVSFCNTLFRNARQHAENVVHKEIAYCRKILRTQTGKDYVGVGEDSMEYEGNDELSKTRRFRSSLTAQKNEQLARKQTRQKPKIYIRVQAPDTISPEMQQKLAAFGGVDGYARTLQRIYDDWWERNGIDNTCFGIVKNAHDEGTSITTTYWDETRQKMKGDLVFRLQRGENFFPEPGCVELDDCAYMFFERRHDIDRAVKEFGKKILEIATKELEGSKKSDSEIKDQDSDEAKKIKVTIIEGYFRDKRCVYFDQEQNEISEEEYEKQKEDGLKPTFEPLYPNGRIISWCGSTLLRDEAYPEDFCPFGKYVANIENFSFWGKPSTRDEAVLQENFDKIVQGIMLHFFSNGFPRAFVKDGVIDENKLKQVVNQYVKIKSQSNLSNVLQYQNGLNVATDGFNLASLLKALLEDVSGIQQAAEGRGTNQKSGRQTIALQESVNEFLSQPARAWEVFLKNEAKKHITLLWKYVGEGYSYEYENEAGMRVIGQTPMALSEIDAVIDVVVSPGSSLPEDRESRANRALMLFQADPMTFNVQWLIKELGLDNDPLLNSPMAQYQRLKMNVARIIQQNPQQAQQMVQTGQLDPELFQIVQMQMMSQQQQTAGQRDVQNVREQYGG